jgi:2-polyprenyl-3-methyl-5-hydroxy-6-metoxy-1,4-benzoquinol methylase
MTTPFERATKPDQYDAEDLLWVKEGRSETTRTGYFREYLEPYVNGWNGKKVLDIGAGTGWLVSWALEKGATKAVGIEPSKANYSMSLHDHPEVTLVNSTLEDFDAQGETFDTIAAVMSFSHIKDIVAAFQKLRSLAAESGEVVILIPDFDYFKLARHEYVVTTQDIDENQYAVSVTRPSGTIADIIRKPSLYIAAAEAAGFELVETKPMPPTETQMAKSPRYASVRGVPLTQLLRFKLAETANG